MRSTRSDLSTRRMPVSANTGSNKILAHEIVITTKSAICHRFRRYLAKHHTRTHMSIPPVQHSRSTEHADRRKTSWDVTRKTNRCNAMQYIHARHNATMQHLSYHLRVWKLRGVTKSSCDTAQSNFHGKEGTYSDIDSDRGSLHVVGGNQFATVYLALASTLNVNRGFDPSCVPVRTKTNGECSMDRSERLPAHNQLSCHCTNGTTCLLYTSPSPRDRG